MTVTNALAEEDGGDKSGARWNVLMIVPSSENESELRRFIAVHTLLDQKCEITTVGSDSKETGTVNIVAEKSFEDAPKECDVVVFPRSMSRSVCEQFLKVREFRIAVRIKRKKVCFCTKASVLKEEKHRWRKKENGNNDMEAMYTIIDGLCLLSDDGDSDDDDSLDSDSQEGSIVSESTRDRAALSEDMGFDLPAGQARPDSRLTKSGKMDSFRLLSHSIEGFFDDRIVSVVFYDRVDVHAALAMIQCWNQVKGVRIIPLLYKEGGKSLNESQWVVESGHGLKLRGPRLLADFARIPAARKSLSLVLIPPQVPHPEIPIISPCEGIATQLHNASEMMDFSSTPPEDIVNKQLEIIEERHSLAVARKVYKKL